MTAYGQLAALFVFLILGISAVMHLATPNRLRRALELHAIFGTRAVRVLVRATPIAEAGISGLGIGALWLRSDSGFRVAAGFAMILLTAYTVYLYGLLGHGVEAPCGCFASSERVSGFSVARSGLLAASSFPAVLVPVSLDASPFLASLLRATALAAVVLTVSVVHGFTADRLESWRSS